MAKKNIHLRKFPILLFVVLLSGLMFSFSSVRAEDNGQVERIVDYWTSNGYREVTVPLPANSVSTSFSQAGNVLAASSAGCVLSQTDMISHWPLDDVPGAITFKDVFDGHDGTCDDGFCPVAAIGKVGGAFTFYSSEGDSINVPTSTDFDWQNTDSLSVGVWVKTRQNCFGNKVFIGRYRKTIPNGSWWVGCTADTTDPSVGVAVFKLRDSNLNHRQLDGISKINDGQWHYVVGVRDGVKDKDYLFVDGVLERSGDVPEYTGHFASDRGLTIGSYQESQDYYYEGVIDEVVIYDRALPANEIESYFKACIVLSPNIFLPVILR